MPKHWGKQIFTHGSFPKMGQKQKTRRKRKKKRERPKVGNNNGQLLIATPPRVVHAKPPGQKGAPLIKIDPETKPTCNLYFVVAECSSIQPKLFITF